MPVGEPRFEIRLARTEDDVRAAQRLRYDVFVRELGSGGEMVDHAEGLERDRFDPFFDHLLLLDHNRPGDLPVVGVYRLLREPQARAAGQFYSEDEYDLSALRSLGAPMMELGRSCLHPEYRGGSGMYHLWRGLAEYVDTHGIRVLFGVASFHGTDVQALRQPLSFLAHNHLAPAELRVRSRSYQDMALIPAEALDRLSAAREIPALIKGYLRLGGFVGDGAFVDHAFNTVDICQVLDVARMTDRQRALYTGIAR